jgi:hypothetical protein
MKNVPTALLLLLTTVALFADDSPIATDRPAVTDSSVVVPLGSFVFENGFTRTTSNSGLSLFDAPETLIRFGVGSTTELRLTAPDGYGAGPSDMAIGVKQQLGPIQKFDVSVVATLSLPTGAKGVSSGGYDFSMNVPWSRPISSNWTAAGMFSVYFPTQDGHHNQTGETAFLLDRQLTKPWDAFVEYVGDFPGQGGPRHLIHAGTAYKIARQHQLDFHFGYGLSANAVDHFFGVGYSFRFQAVKH